MQPVVAMATLTAAQSTWVAVAHHFRHLNIDFAALYSKRTTYVSITHFYSCSFPSLIGSQLELWLYVVVILSLSIDRLSLCTFRQDPLKKPKQSQNLV